jgi:predicted neutral ceramidase superfamily lipid hydrolase
MGNAFLSLRWILIIREVGADEENQWTRKPKANIAKSNVQKCCNAERTRSKYLLRQFSFRHIFPASFQPNSSLPIVHYVLNSHYNSWRIQSSVKRRTRPTLYLFLNINCKYSILLSCIPAKMNKTRDYNTVKFQFLFFSFFNWRYSKLQTFRDILPSMYDPMIMSISFTMIIMYQKFQNSSLPSILNSVFLTRRK